MSTNTTSPTFNIASDAKEWKSSDFKCLTPRSQEAMDMNGLLPVDLLPFKPLTAQEKQNEILIIQRQHKERLRKETIHKCRRTRKKLIHHKWKPSKTEKIQIVPPPEALMNLSLKHSGIFDENDHEKYESKQHTVFDRMVSKHIEGCVTDIVKTSRLRQRQHKEDKKKMQVELSEEPSEKAKKLAIKRQEMEYARIRKQEEIKRKLAESMERIEEIEKQKAALLHENMIAMKEKRETIEKRQIALRKQNQKKTKEKIHKLAEKEKRSTQKIHRVREIEIEKRMRRMEERNRRAEKVRRNKEENDKKAAALRKKKLEDERKRVAKLKKQTKEEAKKDNHQDEIHCRRKRLMESKETERLQRGNDTERKSKEATIRREKMEKERERKRMIENEVRKMKQEEKKLLMDRRRRAEEHKREQLLKKMALREEKQLCLTSRKQEVVKDRRYINDKMNDLKQKFSDELEALLHCDEIQDPEQAVNLLVGLCEKYMADPSVILSKIEHLGFSFDKNKMKAAASAVTDTNHEA